MVFPKNSFFPKMYENRYKTMRPFPSRLTFPVFSITLRSLIPRHFLSRRWWLPQLILPRKCRDRKGFSIGFHTNAISQFSLRTLRSPRFIAMDGGGSKQLQVFANGKNLTWILYMDVQYSCYRRARRELKGVVSAFSSAHYQLANRFHFFFG